MGTAHPQKDQRAAACAGVLDRAHAQVVARLGTALVMGQKAPPRPWRDGAAVLGV